MLSGDEVTISTQLLGYGPVLVLFTYCTMSNPVVRSQIAIGANDEAPQWQYGSRQLACPLPRRSSQHCLRYRFSGHVLQSMCNASYYYSQTQRRSLNSDTASHTAV